MLSSELEKKERHVSKLQNMVDWL